MIDLVYALLIAHSAPGAVPAKQLAPAIMKAAAKYNEDPILITQLIIIESRGKANAYNSDTQDYGLLQINIIHGIDYECLMEWHCNLNHGVRILHNMRKLNNFRPCYWNLGRKGSIKHTKLCNSYDNKLSSVGGFLW